MLATMGIRRFAVPVSGTNLDRLAGVLAKAGIASSLTDPASGGLRAMVTAASPELARGRVTYALKDEEASVGRVREF
jgi:hypothetical protein